MYQALYRKYRSKTFEEIIGQNHVTTALKNQIINNEFSHAYLFSGTRGTGKTSCAKILSRAINCENPIDGNPCNECEACKSILEDRVMDVVEMDAASNNGVDDIRELKDKVIYPPQNLKYKVYIIDEVHMLSKGAFNALLKILEEPPKHLIFILATTEPEKIPTTILSRLQRYNFKRISENEIVYNLDRISKIENREVDPAVFELIANSSDGAMRDSLSLLDQLFSFSDEKLTYERAIDILGGVSNKFLFNLSDAIIEKNLAKALSEMDELYKAGKDITILISDLITHFRNVMVIGATNSTALVNTNQFEEYKSQAFKAGANRVIEIIKILNNTLSIIKYATDKRVMMEMCLVELCTQITDLELRIKELEDKIENIKVGNFNYRTPNIENKVEEPKKVAPQIKREPVEENTVSQADLAKPKEEVKTEVVSDLSTKQLKAEWNQVISNLKNRNKMSTAVLLDKVRDMEVLNGTVVLYFDMVDEMFYKMSSRDENRNALLSLLKETYGDVDLKMEIKDLKNREESIEKLKKLVGEENIDII
ncbi:DNA polymerase-3 subunit gamma/tau [Peptoniphilus asaccharolyticus DSM 20463]|uniref:DNA-directed DNA polymerase n=1 Tax=Peptoniphilus asaccharolyticus DSM 20463 TaxID=573058 RepID=A0A1W1VB67_PEPAS|nr:DNA polymerase III subunit gamma/tau [Peptoniphilus asaccharolyticus]MBL7575741.1 DNA polymerase III subunit gamma/tau [Peptoniphilus asaccharolyticus]SMB90224.1 DNA polymerase-3 subunit gamma/tau [Peptoniphilus asaccharolyticus DSM 20463]